MPTRDRPKTPSPSLDLTRRAFLVAGAGAAVVAVAGCSSPTRRSISKGPAETPSPSRPSESKSKAPKASGEIIFYGPLLVDGQNSEYELGIGRDKSGRAVAFIREAGAKLWTFNEKIVKFLAVTDDSISVKERYAEGGRSVTRLADPDESNEKGKNAPHFDVAVELPDGRIAISKLAITFRGDPLDRYVVATTDKHELPRENHGLSLQGPSSIPSEKGASYDLGGRDTLN